VGTATGHALGNAGGAAERVIKGTLSGIAGGTAAALMRGGKVVVQEIATDSFAQALGNGIVEQAGASASTARSTIAPDATPAFASNNPRSVQLASLDVRTSDALTPEEEALMSLRGDGDGLIKAGVTAMDRNGSDVASDSYIVRAGDNLSKIAKRYGVSVGELAVMNGLSSSRILPGQTLTLWGDSVSSTQATALSAQLFSQDNSRMAAAATSGVPGIREAMMMQRAKQDAIDAYQAELALTEKLKNSPTMKPGANFRPMLSAGEVARQSSLEMQLAREVGPAVNPMYAVASGGFHLGQAVGALRSAEYGEGLGLAALGVLELGIRRESGPRQLIKADSLRAWDMAEDVYAAIRADSRDVAAIAKNIGWSESRVARIKDHIFFNEHQLSSSVSRFDADPHIANAWNRLTQGDFVKADINLLRHEIFESKFEGIFKTPYRTAHDAAIRAGRTWIPE